MENSRLANWFNKQREIIEAAELPFAKLAIFVLPVLAPLVPAVMTSLHMYQLLLEIFTFSGKEIFSGFLSFVVGIVLELLGYVGAITFIRSIFDLVKNGKDEYLIPALLNGLAYLFYLVAMFFINVQLGVYFGVPAIINKIIGLLSFVTVPTGLLAANHLSTKEMKEDDYVLRQEKREDAIKRKMIKQGMNPFEVQYQATAPSPQPETNEKSDWRLLSDQEKYEVQHVLTVKQIMEKYPVKRATAYNWKKGEV